jgi:hypothetical protein
LKISEVIIERTEFTHQTCLGGTEDYEKWKTIYDKRYQEPVITVLIKDGKKVY